MTIRKGGLRLPTSLPSQHQCPHPTPRLPRRPARQPGHRQRPLHHPRRHPPPRTSRLLIRPQGIASRHRDSTPAPDAGAPVYWPAVPATRCGGAGAARAVFGCKGDQYRPRALHPGLYRCQGAERVPWMAGASEGVCGVVNIVSQERERVLEFVGAMSCLTMSSKWAGSRR